MLDVQNVSECLQVECLDLDLACCQVWFWQVVQPLKPELAVSFQRPANSTKDLKDGRWTNRSDLGLQNCCQDSECLENGAPLQSVEWLKHRSDREEQRGGFFLAERKLMIRDGTLRIVEIHWVCWFLVLAYWKHEWQKREKKLRIFCDVFNLWSLRHLAKLFNVDMSVTSAWRCFGRQNGQLGFLIDRIMGCQSLLDQA